MADNSAVAANLKALRARKGVSLNELASETGISQGVLSDYERGAKLPGCNSIVVLARYFNVTTDYLLGVKSEAKSEKNKSVFACRLSELLHGDSQSNLSRATGVTRQAINSYLSGGSEPTICRLTAIAKYFGVPSDYLIGLTDDPTPHAPNIPITSNADIAALLNEIATIAQFRATRIKSEEEE